MTRCRFPTALSLLAGLLFVAAACAYASADEPEPPNAYGFPPETVESIREVAASGISAGFEPPDRGDVPLSSGVLRQAVEAEAGEAEFPQSLQRVDDSVRVEILHSLSSDEISGLVASLGGHVYGEVPGVLAEALVPINGLVSVEAHGGVEYVRPPLSVSIVPEQPPSVGDFSLPLGGGPVVGEEVVKTNVDAWHSAGFAGQGVKIGIIDTFHSDFWEPAQAAGEVPEPAGTFCQVFGQPCELFGIGGDHGVAVAEIIHEQAPSAQLYLATVDTASDMQAAVDYFDANGVDIISRSETAEWDGPGDGTGALDTVLDNAVDDGMTWFNAAGNPSGPGGSYPSGVETGTGPGFGSYWRGGWSDSISEGTLGYLDFDNFTEVGELMPFGCGFVNGLRWDDWGPNRTDYDVYIWDGPPFELDSPTLKVASEDDQGGGAPPIENFFFDLIPQCNGDFDVDYLGIFLFDEGNGTVNDTLEFATNGTGVYYWQNQYSATVPFGDTASPGGLSIGAIDPPNGTTVAPYSAWGPTNDGRTKPDLSAAAGVVGYTYGSRYAARFSGTSAATPSVSGAAAVVLSAANARTTPAGSLPTTPAQLKTFLLGNTVDRGPNGPDNMYGVGELVLPNPPAGGPTNTPTPTPTGGGTPTPTPTPTAGPTATPTPTPPPGSNAVKKLFNGRWNKPLAGNDYETWMDLTTSQPYFECDGGGASCENKWAGPVQNAIDDWNAQQTTVRLVLQPVQSDDHDVHIVIDDSVLGDPSLLGLAVFYDDGFNQCNPDVCDWRYGDALVGDDAHTGPYSGTTDKQATTAHEIGHLLSLRHESTGPFPSEANLYECGFDDTGPIPHSVMAYDCIDPVSIGGAGEYWVQPFDVCGVNTAYPDPSVGMAGCTNGVGPQYLKGDNDCDDDIDSVDALKGLQKIAGFDPPQQPGCPELGSEFASIFGDVDCDGDLDSVDVLFILRHLAGLSVNLPGGCGGIGSLLAGGRA